MATPVGHSLIALSVTWTLARDRHEVGMRNAAASVVLSSLPDLDYVAGFLSGSTLALHQGPTHSLAFCAMVAALGLAFPCLWGGQRWRAGMMAGLLCLSHLALDFFTVDFRLPLGIPLLWPLTRLPFTSPLSLVLPMEKSTLAGMFCPWNAWVVMTEIIAFCPLALMAWRTQRKRFKNGEG